MDASFDKICPAAYQGWRGSCYRFVAAGLEWADAELECESDGGHLVVIGELEVDLDEHHHVHDLSASVPVVWIGVSDRVAEGGFRWVTGSLLDLGGSDCYFAPPEPDDAGGDGQDCVIQHLDVCGDWTTELCWDTVYPFVCEHDGRPADAAAF